jgi:hypothetical protein
MRIEECFYWRPAQLKVRKPPQGSRRVRLQRCSPQYCSSAEARGSDVRSVPNGLKRKGDDSTHWSILQDQAQGVNFAPTYLAETR